MLNVKKDFKWFIHNDKWIYLDNAATSLKPNVMVEAVNNYYEKLSTNSHNSDSPINFKTHSLIEETRKLLADWHHVSKNEIIFTSGASEGLSLVARSLTKQMEKGDEILLNNTEHSSNIVPWLYYGDERGLKVKFVNNDVSCLEHDIINGLTNKTKVVSFAPTSNTMGNNINVYELTKKIKAFNKDIIIVVDATQTVTHYPIDLRKASIDYLVFSAHKILGPTGIGALYIKEELIGKTDPLKFGGGMVSQIGNDCTFKYAAGTDKFEGGTPNIAGIIGWNASIKYIDKLGWNNIDDHLKELAKYLINEMSKIDNIVIYNKEISYPTIIFNYKGVFSQDFCQYLSSNKIICRSGISCARLVPNIIKEETVVRASLYIYNKKEDIDCLVDVIKKYKKGDELDFLG